MAQILQSNGTAKPSVTSTKVEWKSDPQTGLTRITVEGFKSIVDEQEIAIAPLTILAGANSSGKSSVMQPLLLMKQTLESPYDPGALLLNGPNAKFTSAEQVLAKISSKESASSRFSVCYYGESDDVLRLEYENQADQGFEIARMCLGNGSKRLDHF